MALTWEIEVLNPAGAVKASYSPSDQVVRLDSFEVFAGGDCGEANLTAIAGAVDIQPRDIIIIKTRPVGPTAFTLRYRGVCVLAGSPEGVDPQRFRFAGMRGRYYETTTPTARLAAADVGSMAHALMVALNEGPGLPAGTGGWQSIPTTGFMVGDRYPALESVGETLDALAETVGAFIVPTGETYTYDGHTYAEGDTVPAVRWGVIPNGALKFRRTNPVAPLAVSETNDDVVVRWQGVSAEDVVDRVRLVYAAGYVTERLEKFLLERDESLGFYTNPSGAAIPMSRVFTSGDDFHSERVVPIEGPRDYMVRHSDTQAAEEDQWTNSEWAKAFDGNDETYAESAPYFEPATLEHRISGYPEAIVYLDLDLIGPTRHVEVLIEYQRTIIFPRAYMVYGFHAVDANDPTRIRVAIPALPPSEKAGQSWSALRAVLMTSSFDVRVYRFDTYVPDVDQGGTASEKLASGFFRGLPPAVASVELLGIHDPVENVTLTPASGNPAIELHIERTEYAISTERGATTTYHAGQPYEGDLMAQRAVLEALAARAARKHERAQP